jgi:hypothetical protein
MGNGTPKTSAASRTAWATCSCAPPPVQARLRPGRVELHAFRIEEGLERPYLVDQQGSQLVAAHLDLAPAEALQVRIGRVGANLYPLPLGQPHRLAHDDRVGRVEPARDIGHGDVRHDSFVVATLVEAERLSHIAVDLDRHVYRLLLSAAPLQSRMDAIRRKRN